MDTNGLLQTLLSGTRRRLVRLLRPQDRTVRELAEALDLTRNAVRSQLSKLEGDGLVEVTGRQPTRRKPEHVYGLTSAAEALFQKSYGTLLDVVLTVLEDPGSDVEPTDPEAVMEEAGRRLAQSQKPARLESSTVERAERARRVLEEMGGLPEVVQEKGSVRLRGRRCPIASVVASHGPRACGLARALIEELTERPVEQQCTTDGKAPHCQFEIAVE